MEIIEVKEVLEIVKGEDVVVVRAITNRGTIDIVFDVGMFEGM